MQPFVSSWASRPSGAWVKQPPLLSTHWPIPSRGRKTILSGLPTSFPSHHLGTLPRFWLGTARFSGWPFKFSPSNFQREEEGRNKTPRQCSTEQNRINNHCSFGLQQSQKRHLSCSLTKRALQMYYCCFATKVCWWSCLNIWTILGVGKKMIHHQKPNNNGG